eukprot:COSAG06_NODE_58195_length_278_cov_0.178771_1_plen_31_part_10
MKKKMKQIDREGKGVQEEEGDRDYRGRATTA